MIVTRRNIKITQYPLMTYIYRQYQSTFLKNCKKDAVDVNGSTNDWRTELLATMNIYTNFISEDEESCLIKEVEPYLKRLRYEFSHWDDAIHGYRETERLHWSAENTKIINKIREKAFPSTKPQLSLVHVLDLDTKGWIKPHVDSVRFCGDIIAGISLLSDSVMRLTMVGREKECKEDFYLPRRSLYIMSGAARYKYNHEILKDEESIFEGKRIPRGRRVSIICRCEPNPENLGI